MEKENKKPRKKPDSKVLEKFGISKATKIALTGKFLEPITYSEKIEVHESVKKMNSGNFQDFTNSTTKMYQNTSRLREEANGISIGKLERLRENKIKYISNIKLSHEHNQELQREEVKSRAVKTAGKMKNFDYKKIQNIYESSNINIKVSTTSKKKFILPKSEKQHEISLSDEIKKLRVITTNSFANKNVDVESNIKKMNHLTPSTEYFAKEFGWIERGEDEKKSFSNEKNIISLEENNNLEKDDKIVQEFYNNINNNFEESLNTEEFEEIQLSDIQKIEKRYQKEADEIRKQMLKSSIKVEKQDENITNVYERIVSESINAMLSDKKENKHSDIDVSKISSFVLEQIKDKKRTKK